MRRTLSLLLAATAVMFTVHPGFSQQAPRPARDPNVKPAIPGQNINGMHIYIRSGLKSHGEGAHDYPQFLSDWSKVLTEHGAVVDGSFHAPTAEELKGVDVVLFFKGDAGYMDATEKAALEAFVKRGGGIVTIHDSLCGPDPVYFASLVGGAKKHTERNSIAGRLTYTVTDAASPLVKGLNNFSFQDEAFYEMTWAPTGLKVLATVKLPEGRPATATTGWNGQAVGTQSQAGAVIPQVWQYEHTLPGGQPARAFVYMQGHTYENFEMPVIKEMLLRGIAWAGKKPVEELVAYQMPPAPARGGRGGGE
jgi:type 1 glutamine amidotransferase